MAQDLKSWLAEIGLGHHAGRFAADGIDWDVLSDLTEADLRELGMQLGDRKRLLKAIAARNGPAVPAAAPAERPERRESTSTTAESVGERRQITVMFVDLVDSTPLAERLDPEELRDVLRAFHVTCAQAIEAEEGHIARYMGDGILVYFGYPLAHEDDAPRAVRAGLRIIETMQATNEGLEKAHGVRLRSRIGIHTGLVVIGEVGAGSTRDREAIVGETPNIAARLQAQAQPDSLVLGDATRQLVEGLFVLEDLGPLRLKGVSEDVRAWRAARALDVVDRFDTRVRRGMTPLIGRAAELEMLNQRWAQACDGETRCVLVLGEAGIGKSRLLRAFREGLAGQAHEALTLYCSPYHTNSAFAPVAEWLCRALHLNPRSDPEGSAAALDRAATSLGIDGSRMTPVLAALVGLSPTAHCQPADTMAAPFKRGVVEALCAVIGAMARRQPLVAIVEDAHWIDPSTHELLREVLEQLAQDRLLVVISARPEFRPDWRYAHTVQIHLDRLSRRDRAAMVERVAGGKNLPAFVLEQIVSKTDGIPLFVEELTKTVLEGGSLREVGDRYELAGPFQGIAIPDTLQGSLLARLDRLKPETREVAQVGAVIGREFSRELLALVAGRSVDDSDSALAELVAAEIVQPAPRSTLGDGAYVFRHALIQEAAYNSLLLARRRQYHAAIADALTGRLQTVAATQPEIVAQHLTAAELTDRAIDSWKQACHNAKERGAFVESLAHIERGIDLVQRLPEAERDRRLAPLLLAQASVDTLIASPRSLVTLRKVVDMARAHGLTDELVDAALGLSDAELWTNAPSMASVELLEEAMSVMDADESIRRCQVMSRLARSLLYAGEAERARDMMGQARILADRLDDKVSLRELVWCELMPNSGPPPTLMQFDQRRRKLRFLRQLSEDSGLREKSNAYVITASSFLELGDVEEFDSILEAYGNVRSFRESRVDKWTLVTYAAMKAILSGDFLSAERLASEAFESSYSPEFPAPMGIYGMQMFTIRREQGRLAEVAPLVKRFVEETPESAAWRPGLMIIASDLGFTQQARATFDAMASNGFVVPVDTTRSVTLSYLTEVCSRLEDRENAARLYDLLLPYRDLAIVVGQSTVCCGAAARYLGILAATMQDWSSSGEHFEAALALDERMKAWPWLAHTRFQYSRALLARGRREDKTRAEELRSMAMAAAERLGMGSLTRRIANVHAPG